MSEHAKNRWQKSRHKSIAFPCISIGVYGYPIDDAAKIAVREVREFSSPAETQRRREEMLRRSFASEGRFGEAEPEGCASIREDAAEMEVIFCCFSERDKRVYEALIHG